MTPTRTRPPRPGFTIPELLVAMAVALGIMVILAESFRMGMDFSRFARATGEHMTHLQAAGAILTRDIQAEHFFPEDNKYARGVRLIDQRLDKLTTAGPNANTWTPPKGGFFRIVSPKPTYYQEVPDRIGIGYWMNSANNHALHFTAILLGDTEQNKFAATVTVNGVNNV